MPRDDRRRDDRKDRDRDRDRDRKDRDRKDDRGRGKTTSFFSTERKNHIKHREKKMWKEKYSRISE